jgi:hypothetical protein
MTYYKTLTSHQIIILKTYLCNNNKDINSYNNYIKSIFPDLMTITIEKAQNFMDDIIQLFEECVKDFSNNKGWANFKNNNFYYTGYIVNNVINYFGKYYWLDGHEYIGRYNNNLQEGLGIYKWPSSGKFIGFWKNDKMNGLGLYIQKNNIIYYGNWYNDKQNNIGIKGNYMNINNKKITNEEYYFQIWNKNNIVYQKEIRKHIGNKLNELRFNNCYTDVDIKFN